MHINLRKIETFIKNDKKLYGVLLRRMFSWDNSEDDAFIEDMIYNLLSLQRENGSWLDSPYHTAKCIELLTFFKVKGQEIRNAVDYIFSTRNKGLLAYPGFFPRREKYVKFLGAPKYRASDFAYSSYIAYVLNLAGYENDSRLREFKETFMNLFRDGFYCCFYCTNIGLRFLGTNRTIRNSSTAINSLKYFELLLDEKGWRRGAGLITYVPIYLPIHTLTYFKDVKEAQEIFMQALNILLRKVKKNGSWGNSSEYTFIAINALKSFGILRIDIYGSLKLNLQREYM